MVSGWMFHFMLVGSLLGGAGLLLEAVCGRLALPRRGAWVLASIASVALPLASWLRPAPAPAASETPLLATGIPVLRTALPMPEPPAGWENLAAGLDPLLLALWGTASGLLLIHGALSILRLRRAMPGWTGAQYGDLRVLLSEATGPAVVGVRGRAIVLPRWVAASDPTVRDLILAHEQEHIRAADPALLLAARLLAALLPWNVPLWWQVRRLRLAVEVDCDARVLRRGFDLRSYATLLIEVGRRRAGLDPALVAFAEPASFLERRIRTMTRHQRRTGWGATVAITAAAVALVLGACGLQKPTGPAGTRTPVPDEGPVDVYPGSSAQEAVVTTLSERPAFTPREREPQLLNRAEFAAALEQAYPPLLKQAGIGGRVLLWVFIDENGRVRNVTVNESSGHEEFDAAAETAIRGAQFTPAVNRGMNVPVWIALPISFVSPSTDGPAAAAQRAPGSTVTTPRPAPTREARVAGAASSAGRPLSAEPAFTPREVEPALLNRAEFGRELERMYPAVLKDAGVGGRAVLWVFVEATGRVGNVRVQESSGHEPLDAAAESVLRSAEFSPAMYRGTRVPVWIAVPVTFDATRPAGDTR